MRIVEFGEVLVIRVGLLDERDVWAEERQVEEERLVFVLRDERLAVLALQDDAVGDALGQAAFGVVLRRLAIECEVG